MFQAKFKSNNTGKQVTYVPRISLSKVQYDRVLDKVFSTESEVLDLLRERLTDRSERKGIVRKSDPKFGKRKSILQLHENLNS